MSATAGQSLFYLGGIDLPMPQARAVQTLHTAHSLARLGNRVFLAVGRAPRAELPRILASYGLRPEPNLTILALPTLRLPALPLDAYVHPRLATWNWSYGLAAIAALRLLPASRRPRLVLARDPRLAWLFLQARPLTGADVVYEVHELFSTRARVAADERDRPSTRAPRLRRLEASVFRRARRLVTLTESCQQLLVDEFGVAPERVLVAPDAVAEVPAVLPPPAADRASIIYAGQLYPWKGVSTLIEALMLLPEARLKVVGGLGDNDPNTLALQALASRHGVVERLELSGFLPHARVAAALRGSAVAVVPLPDNPMSRYFTSPLKLYEYMAAGLPIVASDLPALREVLRHEQNALLFPPGDSAALARSIRRLLDEPELAERLRRQAFADLAGWTWLERARRLRQALAD